MSKPDKFTTTSEMNANSIVSNWCIRNANRCFHGGEVENALIWGQAAAEILSFECENLMSYKLEELLLNIGKGLKVGESKGNASGKYRVLHVVTRVSTEGGHTAMLRRWIRMDPDGNVHNLAITAQSARIPYSLVEVVHQKKGIIFHLDQDTSLSERAIALNQIARSNADLVVLHTHPWEILTTVAFARPGGPPVIQVNHAAHIHWTGIAVSDIVVNCRISAQEDTWSLRYRNARKIQHLPIPVDDPTVEDKYYLTCQRQAVRKRYGIPETAPLLLTVGLGMKYTEIQTVSFLDTIDKLLTLRKQIYLLAVGPSEDAKWKCLVAKKKGHIVLIGPQPDTEMPLYFATSDIYLEGFPFGSTTALLEAGIRNLPTVLAPEICPAPFTTDGIAIEGIYKAPDLNGYIDQILKLLDSAEERRATSRKLAESIRLHHCEQGWVSHLQKLIEALPKQHEISLSKIEETVNPNHYTFWAAFSKNTNAHPLIVVLEKLLEQKLTLKVDFGILQLLRHHALPVSNPLTIRLLIGAILASPLGFLFYPHFLIYRGFKFLINALDIGRRDEY